MIIITDTKNYKKKVKKEKFFSFPCNHLKRAEFSAGFMQSDWLLTQSAF